MLLAAWALAGQPQQRRRRRRRDNTHLSRATKCTRAQQDARTRRAFPAYTWRCHGAHTPDVDRAAGCAGARARRRPSRALIGLVAQSVQWHKHTHAHTRTQCELEREQITEHNAQGDVCLRDDTQSRLFSALARPFVCLSVCRRRKIERSALSRWFALTKISASDSLTSALLAHKASAASLRVSTCCGHDALAWD